MAALWGGDHPLPVTVDFQVIAPLIKVVLDFERHGNVALATGSCNAFLKTIVNVSGIRQRAELQAAGIEPLLHRLLQQHHSHMSPLELEDLLACTLAFTELSTTSIAHWDESSTQTLAALVSLQPTSLALQVSAWNLLAAHSRLAKSKPLVPGNVLERAVSALKQGDASLSGAVLHFLYNTCKANKEVAVDYLQCDGLVSALQPLVAPGSTAVILKDICYLIVEVLHTTNTTDANMIDTLEECARLSPGTCLIPVCTTLQDLTSSRKFYERDHSTFFRDMLSNEEVYSNELLLKPLYTTLSRVLKRGTPTLTTLPTLYTSNFVSFLVTTFERDTHSATLAPSVVDMWLDFLPTYEGTKALMQTLQSAGFLVSLVKMLPHMASSRREYLLTNAVCLLSRVVAIYKTNKLDMVEVVRCGVQDFISECMKTANLVRTANSQQLATNLCLTLLDIVLSKEACVELHKVGYTEKLVQLRRPDCPLIHRFVTTALSNIAYYERKAQGYLIEKQHHMVCLSLIKSNPGSQDYNLLAACCTLIKSLSEDDTVKETLIKNECVSAVMTLLKLRVINSYLISNALGLLSSLLSSSITECDRLLTDDIVHTVSSILLTYFDEYIVINAAILLVESIQVDRAIPLLYKAVPVATLLSKPKQCQGDLQGLKDVVAMLTERLSLNCLMALVPSTMLDASLYGWPITSADPTWSGMEPCSPAAPELDETTTALLVSLGLSADKPVFRIGQMDGIQSIHCGCHVDESKYDNLIVRPHGLTLEQYQELIDYGWFRRGGVKLYRTTQCHDFKCSLWETRVLVKDFNYRSSKSYTKVMRRMPVDRLTVETHPAHYSQEAHALYDQYNIRRHDKHRASGYHYREHVVDSPIKNQTVDGIGYGSYHQMYRLDGKLVAVGLIDIVPKGIVSLYMWYSLDKEVSKYSLGVYSALKEIEMVQELSRTNPEMKYYYLQGWSGNDKKLSYKASYPPEEFFCACITPEWLPSLEAVKEAKEKYLQEHTHDQNGHPSSTPIAVDTTDKDKKVSTDVPCSAFEKDRAKYEQLTGHKPDVNKMVVCLNYTTYMYLGEVFSKFNVDQSQKELMERRFEELLVTIGPDLSANLVVDLKATSLVS